MNKEIITYYEASLNYRGLLDHYIMQCRHITTHVLQLELNECLNIGWRLIKEKAGRTITQSTLDYYPEKYFNNPQYTFGVGYIEDLIEFLKNNDLSNCVILKKHDDDITKRFIHPEWCILTIDNYNDYLMTK